MTIRLVATDLDGTLIRSDGTVSSRNRRALDAMQASGRLVVFVSGRPPRWLNGVAEETGQAGMAICANGALRYDLRTGEISGERFIDPATMRAVVRRLRADMPELAFAVEYGDGFAQEPGYTHHYDLGLQASVGPIERFIGRPAAKLLARHTDLDADTLLAKASEAAGDLATFTHSSFTGILEISALGVTKASGLAELAKERGIAADEVLAFGDMPNDLAMLEWAGRSVAVANAHPAVRAIADEITASNDDDGVARVLERLP